MHENTALFYVRGIYACDSGLRLNPEEDNKNNVYTAVSTEDAIIAL